MLTLSITSESRPTLRDPLLMRAVKLRKNDKDRRKKPQSKQRQDEEVNATSSRDIRTFFEKPSAISSTKTSTPKSVVELNDDE